MLPRSMRANNGFVIMLPAREAIHKRVCTGNSCVEVLQFVCNRVNLQSNKVMLMRLFLKQKELQINSIFLSKYFQCNIRPDHSKVINKKTYIFCSQ